MAGGALLVDTRPSEQRRLHGEIDGAVVVERNVLEWRMDPTSEHRIGDLTGPDHPVVIACQEGYASSLAVASLTDLGLTQVVDLDGGFAAWKAAGLSVI